MVLEFFILGAGRRRKKKKQQSREGEVSPLLFLLVLLSWDLILSPYWEGGREGVGFLSLLLPSLLSSQLLTAPPPKADRRLGSGDSNPCRLAMLPTRSTPSGLPPFSYCLIQSPSHHWLLLPVGCSTSSSDRNSFAAYSPVT